LNWMLDGQDKGIDLLSRIPPPGYGKVPGRTKTELYSQPYKGTGRFWIGGEPERKGIKKIVVKLKGPDHGLAY